MKLGKVQLKVSKNLNGAWWSGQDGAGVSRLSAFFKTNAISSIANQNRKGNNPFLTRVIEDAVLCRGAY